MSDPRITPRAAAFQHAPSLERAQGEQANALATHGDPSLQTKTEAGTATARRDGRVHVEWVHAGDLAHRLLGSGLSRGAELHMRAHAWLRTQGQREIPLHRPRREQLPPASDFGQDAPQRQSPGNTLTR